MISRQFWGRRRAQAVLKLAFWAVVTPVGLLKRAAGSDRLGLKLDPRAASYWQQRDLAKRPVVMTDQT